MSGLEALGYLQLLSGSQIAAILSSTSQSDEPQTSTRRDGFGLRKNDSPAYPNALAQIRAEEAEQQVAAAAQMLQNPAVTVQTSAQNYSAPQTQSSSTSSANMQQQRQQQQQDGQWTPKQWDEYYELRNRGFRSNPRY